MSFSLIFAQYGVITGAIIANVLQANVGAHIKRSSRWTFSSNPPTKKKFEKTFLLIKIFPVCRYNLLFSFIISFPDLT